MNKTGKKTAKSPRSGAVIPTGAHPGNTGGKKGRSGRKPDWLKAFCDEILSSKETRGAAKAIMKDKDHSAFATMWKTLAERAHGKPKETIDLTITDLASLSDEELAKRRAALGLT